MLAIITLFPENPDRKQRDFFQELIPKIRYLSYKINIHWFIVTNNPDIVTILGEVWRNLKITIVTHSSYRSDGQDSENLVWKRKVGISSALKFDDWEVLSFMDADDYPHNEHNEYLSAIHQVIENGRIGVCHAGLRGQMTDTSYFARYSKYQQWLKVNAASRLERGEPCLASGSCLIFPKKFVHTDVDEKWSGIEDIVWAYKFKRDCFLIPIFEAVHVYPSRFYLSEGVEIHKKRTELVKEFYKQNGYKAYSQIGYNQPI
jgi:glycosyltransferase involved in cell wall biosynthesis